jgi:hypothetical protein
VTEACLSATPTPDGVIVLGNGEDSMPPRAPAAAALGSNVFAEDAVG